MNSTPAPDRPDDPESPVDSAMPLLDRLSGFRSLGMTHAPGRLHLLTRLSAGLCVAAVIGLVVLPWRQFVSGSGRVIAFNPLERSLTVESPLPGKVQRAFVVEGQEVKEGEALFEIVDNDPNLFSNLLQQRDAAQARRDAARTRVESLGLQIGEQERALPLAIEAAKTRLSPARYAADTARLQFDRVKALHEDPRGPVPRRDFELTTLERDRTEAELVRAQAELERTPVDLRAAIQGITAPRDSARAELAVVQARRRFEAAGRALSLFLRDGQENPVVAGRDRLPPSLPMPEGPEASLLQQDVVRDLTVRPEVRRLSLNQDRLEVDRRLAKNQLLPNLDAGVTTSRDYGDRGYKDQTETEVQVGVELRVLLQRREARGGVAEVEAQLEQNAREQQFARDRIQAEVRDSFSAWSAAHEQTL